MDHVFISNGQLTNGRHPLEGLTLPSLVGTSSVTTLAVVGDAIAPTTPVKEINNTSGGSLTLTSNPMVTAGVPGQILVLFNPGANPIVFTDGQGVNLSAATRTVGANDTLVLLYANASAGWLELSFSSN